MLQLSNLAGLWALAALTVPLVLHLWRPPARTVRFGSVRFLQGLPRRRLNHLRWREHLLLLSRLLLLTILVLLLTSPFWRRLIPEKLQRWVLISPGTSLNGAALEHVRGLLATGYELHRFTAGFPVTNLDAVTTNELSITNREVADDWSLIREADATLPEHSELVVYSDGQITSLKGLRPILRRCHVEWIPLPINDDDSEWIQSAKLVGIKEAAALDVLVGFSNSATTRFYSQKVPARAGRISLKMPEKSIDLEISDSGGKFFVRLVKAGDRSGSAWVDVRPQDVLHVLIAHDDDRMEDARYVEAAVRTVAQVDERKLVLTTTASDQPVAEAMPDRGWVFWLSRRVVPESITSLVAEGKVKLLTDAMLGDTPSAQDSWISVPAGVKTPSLPTGMIDIKVQVAPLPDSEVPLWTDGFGDALLTLTTPTKGERLRFLSRFNPAWNDLPSTGALTAMMRSMFTDSTDQPDLQLANDHRTAGLNQVVPNVAAASHDATYKSLPTYEKTDLHTLFWVMTFLCFCLERFLAHHQPSSNNANRLRQPAQPSLVEVRP